MSSKPLVKIAAAPAAEVCARFDVKKEALAVLRNGMTPGDFVGALMSARQYLSAIDFIAHALAMPEAVWWGCLCLQHGCGNNLSAAEKAACRAAVQWVLHPNEENRTAVLAPAQAAGAASPAAALAMAVYQSAGNVPLPNTPPLPAFAAAKTIAGAVKMICAKAEPVRIVETQRLFAELGIGVAEGRFR